MLRYKDALHWICISVVCYGALQTETKTKTKTKTKKKTEVGVVSGRVSQLVSILKTTDMLCINITKIIANIEYLIHRVLNNNK